MNGVTIEAPIPGRSMLIVGTTFTDEHVRTHRRLREQRTELTASEREAQVAEIGTVRAGDQVVSPIITGAVAGAALGGPVGVMAGIGVGLILRALFTTPFSAAHTGPGAWL